MTDESSNSKPEKKRTDLLTGLIVGGAVGSVLSLLFSTKKGRKASKSVGKKALELGKEMLEKR